MTAAVTLLAAKGESSGVNLPVPPWVVGVGAFTLLCVLLAVTLTFGKDR
jgi:hypothetical protein